jgi:glycosyl hydrolase family 123
MYQSCMSHDCGGTNARGWPSYMIDALAVRNRAMQWLLFSKQTTGELYWETGYALYAKRDAWIDQWAFTGNGDGTLFYPGTPAKIGGTSNVPIASIRLKMIREGMEDFEYLTKLASFGPSAKQEALQIATAQFPDAGNTGYDGAAAGLMSRRQYLACRILEYQADPSAADRGSGCPTP